MPIHLIFDLIASALSFLATLAAYRWRLAAQTRRIDSIGLPYAAALISGAALGGYGFGTLNLWLGGNATVGRSILGALFGAILAVEAYKAAKSIRGSTGLIFVPAFCTSVIVGRIGCFLAGLADDTYGTPSNLPWAHDFGDGLTRHPVQLYESAAMGLFAIYAVVALAQRSSYFLRNGFYLMVGAYALQRFVWEFLKPYASVLGPFNLFHLICLMLLLYSATMIRRTQNV
ncbi:MAG: prolipoprotein diacylglyceryl transferase family protein [Paracoccaceae bacterium]